MRLPSSSALTTLTKSTNKQHTLSLRARPRYTDWCRRRDFDAAQEDAALAHLQDCQCLSRARPVPAVARAAALFPPPRVLSGWPQVLSGWHRGWQRLRSAFSVFLSGANLKTLAHHGVTACFHSEHAPACCLPTAIIHLCAFDFCCVVGPMLIPPSYCSTRHA